VTLREEGTGLLLSGAELSISEGSYVEQLREQEAGIYIGAVERAGTYDLVARLAGYEESSILGIEVTEGVCHVTTQELAIDMQPSPSQAMLLSFSFDEKGDLFRIQLRVPAESEDALRR
jgi:hypothetical protein